MAFRKIVAGLVKNDINTFVGEVGNIFFDTSNGDFRLSDGLTPGGIPLGSGGGGYILPTASTTVKGGVKIDGTTITISGSGVISGFDGNYNSLTNKPVIPAAQIQSDWTQTNSSSLDFIKNKPTIATSVYIGTTNVAFNRASGNLTLNGVSIDGNAATVTNGVYTTGSYSNPSWITSLAYSKITGAPTPYTLPTASPTVLGGIKIGSGLSIDPSGVVSATGSVAQLTVSEINTANDITNEVLNVSKIRFDKDTGFSVQDLGSGEIKVSLGSSFKTWKVNGQTDLVAVGEDTVEFIAGDGIALTTNPTAPNKSMTITSNMYWSSKSW
jgi:hypothetical protein